MPPNPLNEPIEEPSEEKDSPRLDLGDEDSGRRDVQIPDTTGADFEVWWVRYPKKVDKVAARRAYGRVVKSGAATPDELLNGAMRYAAERQQAVLTEGAFKAKKYTKGPERWLNAGSWADEPAEPISGGYDHIATGVAMAQQIMQDDYYGS